MICRRYIVFLFLLCQPVLASAKKKRVYTSGDIITLSDSVLRSRLGDSLLQYCKWDSSSYYIWQKGEKEHFVVITEEEKINSSFTSASIRYHFTMPYNECAAYDTVSGTITFELRKQDSVFNLAAEPDLNFIPEMALKHQPCNFLTSVEALEKASAAGIQTGITPAYAHLQYIANLGKFVWIVQSLLWEEKNFDHEHEPTKDIVILDAVSGATLKHTHLLYTKDISDIL